MIRPTMDEARKLCEQNTIVPICLELFSDIKTPIEVLKRLKDRSKQVYLLESVDGGERWGRYSFLGFEPELSVVCHDGIVEVQNGRTRRVCEQPPQDVLREILSSYKSPRISYLPAFTGGFVGYISYEYIKYTEKSISFESSGGLVLDDLNVMLFDKIIAFDHLRQKIMIIVNIKTDALEENYIDGVIKLKEIESIIKEETKPAAYTGQLMSGFTPLFSQEYYCEMVERTKARIYEGDIFQAVISNRVQADFEGDLLSSYRVLRTVNPSPYMFYLDFGGVQIAGASPETLVTLRDARLSVHPIAGTCPRGATPQEDEELITALLQNEKELAQHNMLVDLARNDLGKISEFGSVTAENYQSVVKFSHISQISSIVTGQLRSGLDQLDVISAVLPAGTLSGVPKIRAMEIINELEGERRGVYGGAIGYIDFSGNMDMCIAIRMAVKTDGKVYVSTGAGIVADSEAENEYNECIHKAGAMIEALERSREVE